MKTNSLFLIFSVFGSLLGGLSVQAQTAAFAPPVLNPFGLSSFGYFTDMDNDGDLDNLRAEFGQVVYTPNLGTRTNPVFGASMPVTFAVPPTGLDFLGLEVVDLDQDGDKDLFLSTYDDNNFLYYQNTGSATAPVFGIPVLNPFALVFPLIVRGYSPITETYQYENWLSPTFADLDQDGDLDLLVGSFFGDTYYFRNVGTATVPYFANVVVNPFGLGNVGRESRPAFADLDRDGDLDAFIGALDGSTHYFRNAGTAAGPAFVAAGTNPFGLAAVGARSKVRFADLDDDTDVDAFIANNSNQLAYFENQAVPGVPGRLAQVISGFVPFPVLTTATLSYAITGVSGGASGNPVVFSSSNPAVATVSGLVLTVLAPGTTTIVATQVGNAAYTSATNVSQVLTVLDNPSKVAQTISGFGPIPLQPTVGGTYTITGVTGGASGNPVVFTSSDLGFATVSGNVITTTGRGIVTITATQAANRFYSAAPPVSQTLTIGTPRLPQAITGLGPFPSVVVGSTYTITGVAGGGSGNPVVLTVSNTGPVVRATISGNVVTALAVGTVIVSAEQAENAAYDEAMPETAVLRIIEDPAKLPQLITGIPVPIPTQRVGIPYSLVGVAGGASGNPVVFTSSNPAVATVSGSVLTFLAPGSVTITANQAGNSAYQAAPPVIRSFRVTWDPAKGNQNIIGMGFIPDQMVGTTYTLTGITGGASGNPVVFSSSNPAVATVSGSLLTFLAPGRVVITASQAGNAAYNAATNVASFVQVLPLVTATTSAAGPAPQLNIYPNPAPGGRFFIEADVPGTAVLYNALGAVVRTWPVTAGANAEISGLNPGLYILQINSPKGRASRKVIVE